MEPTKVKAASNSQNNTISNMPQETDSATQGEVITET